MIKTIKEFNGKFGAIFIIIVTIFSILFGMNQTFQVKASTKNYMKNLGVKFDLKPDKTITYKTRFASIGLKEQEATLTNYKIENAKKEGYKKLTFVVKFSGKTDFTDSQIHKIINSNYVQKKNSVGNDAYCAVVDYNTGIALEKKNDYNVTVKSNWSLSKEHEYKDKDGCAITAFTYKLKVTVTYPKNYKGLCIGIGGSTALKEDTKNQKNNNKFWSGKLPFGKTTYYSKTDKDIAHFMRVK